MPQHELEHCDICHKLNAKGVLFCVRCNVGMCKECSEGKDVYLLENHNGDPLCNNCADWLEAGALVRDEEELEM